MTVAELAKILERHIARGGADQQVTIFQWQHGRRPLSEAYHCEGMGWLELYSDTDPTEPDDLAVLARPKQQPADDDDLIGLDPADLDDLI